MILGADQYGLVAEETAEAMGRYERIIFLDNKSSLVVWKLNEVEKQVFDEAFIAIGNREVRSRYVKEVESHGRRLATLIHPKSVISPSAKLDCGCIVEAGVMVSTHSLVGKCTSMMANVVIGNDASVGECCLIRYNGTAVKRDAVSDRSLIFPNCVWEE